jgi:type I restriction enzyme, S subunit
MSGQKVAKGYKQTEVGVIPEDWDVKAVGEICDFIVPGRNKPTQFQGDIPWITTPDLEDGRGISESRLGLFVSRDEAKNVGSKIVPRASVLMSCVGELGIVAFVEKEIVINQQLHAFIPTSKIHPLFLMYALQSCKKFMLSVATITAVPYLNKDNCNSIPIALPTIAEQKQIARALSDIDALIEGLEGAIGKKRHIKQGAMQELLTGKRRLPGFGEGKGYKQTEVGVIPKDWDLVLIGQLVKDFRGGAPLKPSDFVKFGVKVLPKGGVGRDTVLSVAEKDQQFCSQHYADTHFNNQVNSSYTIVVLRDLVPSGPSIGLMVEIIDSDNYVLAQGVYGFKVDIERVIPSWFIHLSNTHSYRKLMNSIMVGSTQVHVTNTAFKQAKVLLPCNIEEQQAIATILSDMDSAISTLEAKLTKTRQLKQGMMHELLTGRIRLV